MDIRSLCICDHITGGFWHSEVPATVERKTVPMLSVVQSVRGSYEIAIDGGPTAETGPMGVFVAPRQVEQCIRHIPDKDGTMDAHWVFFDVEINRLYKLDDLYTFPAVLPSAYNAEVFELIQKVNTDKNFFGRLPALHRLAEILYENATPRPRISEEIVRLRSYVENHYMRPITPDDLQRVLHCSRSAMYRHFREGLDESPAHYINRVRIRHAQLLLSDTDRSIGDIAAAVGIPDVFYFARLFRQFTGQTAGNYRKIHRVATVQKP